MGVNIIGFENGGANTRTPAQATGDPTKSINVVEGAHTELTASTAWESILLNLSSTKTFNTGNIGEIGAISVSAPTYAFEGSSTITGAGSLVIPTSPQAGTNGAISFGANVLLGATGGTQTNADSDHSLLIVIPGITDRVGNVTKRAGMQMFGPPGQSVDLGNQTATLTDLAGIEFGDINLSSDTNTRTVTNATTVVINKAPASSGNITFTNPPLSLHVRADPVRFDGGIMTNTTTLVTDFDLFNASATTTMQIISGSGSLGGRIVLEDVDGSGCTEITTLNGTITGKTITCP